MKKFSLLFVLLFPFYSLFAKVLISPVNAMKENYAQYTSIQKKVLTLSPEQMHLVQQNAKVKLHAKKYTVYIAQKNKKILGYGILINKKVRSKNSVILYFIEHNELKDIEIIAFNEPQEYLPSKEWQKQFQNKKTTTNLQLSKNIPNITGATLSARAVVESSRIAFALYNNFLKGN